MSCFKQSAPSAIVSVSAMLDIHVKKISLKFLFLSDIFLFPFVRQQFPVLAYRCSWRQCCRFVDNIGYIFKEVNTLQSAGACKGIEHSCPFGTSMRPEETLFSSDMLCDRSSWRRQNIDRVANSYKPVRKE